MEHGYRAFVTGECDCEICRSDRNDRWRVNNQTRRRRTLTRELLNDLPQDLDPRTRVQIISALLETGWKKPVKLHSTRRAKEC